MPRESILAVWRRAIRIVDKRLEAFYAPHGYNQWQLRILMTIRKSERAVQGEIADRLGINRNVMVRIVDDMESRGIVLRQRNPHNRKELLLIITKQGREALKFVDETYEKVLQRAFHPLTIHDVEIITQGMQKIVDDKT